MSNRVRAREPPARTQTKSAVPRTMPSTGFSSSTSRSSSSSRAPIAMATSITSSNRGTSMTSGHVPHSARFPGKRQRLAERPAVSRHSVFNHLSITVPIVLLLIVFCGDFARLSGVDLGGGGGGVLADEMTTVPPEETWTTSTNENVGTGEAAPFDATSRGLKKFGDKCESTTECGFAGSFCDPKKHTCQCTVDLPATNHIDKCGKKRQVNETCFFSEQCEAMTEQTECRDGRCICLFEMNPFFKPDGSVECRAPINKPTEQEKYIDPAMIGVLVAMAVMFIIICVVLRLFSKARWRENRTIFNTPNPRLMNVSLLRDNKLLHGQERRGSRMSVRLPSRQPSMASLRPHSPNASIETQSYGKKTARADQTAATPATVQQTKS
uniref:EB domain-containing protein n=1 Tax=Anopheles atroparvus TaxID=41427 RepID=A0AAG5CP28_ANOAO